MDFDLNTGRRTWVRIIHAIIYVFIVSCAFAAEEPVSRNNSAASYKDIQTFANALTILQRASGEHSEQNKFLYAALQAMTENLDRYSYFVSPEVIGLFHEGQKSKYVGIGIQLARSSDGANLEIVSVEDDSPAKKANLEPGDLITAIDGKLTRQMRLIDAVKSIMSPGLTEGSQISLSVLKPGRKEPTTITLERAVIKPPVLSWNVPEKGIGYVKITKFNKSTVADFKKGIEAIAAKTGKIRGIIIDLRNNPGGDIESTVDLVRLFINDGVIVTLDNKLEDNKVVYKANATGVYDWPLAILVDKGTASASELFAGALQFHKKAILVGCQTFGKGVFQSLIPLSNDAGLYITIGAYYLPDGTSVNGLGILPDVSLPKGLPESSVMAKALEIVKINK